MIAPLSFSSTSANLQAIADHACDLAARASHEYPGYVRIVTLNGRIGHLGTANGPWAVDVYRTPRAEQDGTPEAARTVPVSHASTAEGIARYCVGIMAGIHEYTAYASDREMKRANRAERSARDR